MKKSSKKITFKRVLIALLLILVVLQFFRIDKTVPEYDTTQDFLAMTTPSQEIHDLVKTACYDCHSFETEYPWYSNISPISWWVGDHIEEGREELNFSLWGTYKAERAEHKLEECAEEVEEGKMPLSSYTITHGDADLNGEQKELLEDWFNAERAKILDSE